MVRVRGRRRLGTLTALVVVVSTWFQTASSLATLLGIGIGIGVPAACGVAVLRCRMCELRFVVGDDGRGFDTRSTNLGTGVQGTIDRLDSVGGRLDLTSEPGIGTTAEGMVPIPSGAEA
ncbi:MAG TPA: hypothetical protein VLA82_11525 [Actinomycetota bacterium]|nr:hypothetical protein [Actinomycetota bacterium]